MRNLLERRTFGRAGFTVTALGFGTVALGNLGQSMSDEVARSLVQYAWDRGVRLFDTAPMYGHGLAESRLAAELTERRRDDYVLVTKVGRSLTPAEPNSFDSSPWVDTPSLRIDYDYSYDGVMRQVDESLHRMGTDHFDVLLVHDIDRWTHGDAQPQRLGEALDGAFPALLALRDQGVVRAIGAGVNDVDVSLAVAGTVDIDCLLIAGTYTLLNQEAGRDLLPLCVERGIAVINGRVFGSGVLATGPTPRARFDYAPAPQEVLTRVAAIEKLCRSHAVEIGAAALQFAGAHGAIANVCVGASSVNQQKQNFLWSAADIPAAFWGDLADSGLVEMPAPNP